MTTGVAESMTGTMPETKGRETSTPEVKGRTPEPASKVSLTEEAPKLYTQKDLDAFVHAVKSEAGRDKSQLQTEVASLKSQIQNKDNELSDNDSEIEKLQAKFDDLASGDPTRFDAAKELKAAREERKQLKAERSVLATKEQTYGEVVKLAHDTLREISIWELAAEYENGDPVKLKELCATLEAKSDEQIRKAADILWTKKTTEPSVPATPGVKPYSGKTEGGGGGGFTREQIANMPMEEYAKLRPQIEQAYMEGKIK